MPFNKIGSIVCVPSHRERCRGVGSMGSMRIKSRGRGVNRRFARDRRFAAGQARESNGSV
jgi:hypothetical protein